MPEFTAHDPGTFCWVELMTTDADNAKSFYNKIFGWDHHDDVISENQVYTMLLKNGKNAGALYQRNEQQAKLGLPAHWASYVSVDDADATIARVKEGGGTVVLEPLDVFDIGRMAVFQEPTGAQLCIWQPKKHIGAQIRDETGAFCWNELMTRDPERAGAFLEGIFDWQRKTEEFGGMPYTVFMKGDKTVGGMLKIQKEWGEVPSHWLVYFTVDDCDATIEQIKTLGGGVMAGPYDLAGVGRFAVVSDPAGAGFGVIKSEEGAG